MDRALLGESRIGGRRCGLHTGAHKFWGNLLKMEPEFRVGRAAVEEDGTGLVDESDGGEFSDAEETSEGVLRVIEEPGDGGI